MNHTFVLFSPKYSFVGPPRFIPRLIRFPTGLFSILDSFLASFKLS